jgi:hypothetical protein
MDLIMTRKEFRKSYEGHSRYCAFVQLEATTVERKGHGWDYVETNTTPY